MLKRSTVISIILLTGLIGLAVYLSRQDNKADTDIDAPPTQALVYLFNESDGLPDAITIQDKSAQVVAVRKDASGAWIFEKPIGAAAQPGFVETATSQLATLRILNTLADMPPSAVGLDQPDFVIAIQFNSGKETSLKIGNLTPTNSGYYAQKENGEIIIVGKAGVDSLLEIFRNPPLPVTATP